MQCPQHSPWGPVQHNECLAPGIYFVHTAGHGGIWISPDRRATMAEPYRNFTSKYGNIGAGFYEEDCDWAVPVLAFAPELAAQFVTLAQKTLELDRKSGRNYYAALHTKRIEIPPAVEFDESAIGGAFDGNQVTSDADPGL